MTQSNVIPALRLHNRLDLALEHADIGVSEMADELGVSRNTISNYIHGKSRPNKATLVLWATRCGVDFAWLANGAGGGAPMGADTLCELRDELDGQLDIFDSALDLCAA